MSGLQKRRAVETHSAQADQFALRYRELAEDPYRSCFTYSRHRLEAWLERFLPVRAEGLRALDLGCGTGEMMVQLRTRGYEVAGVDGSEAMLEHARASNPGADLRRSDVEQVPFADSSFDLVLCVEVLRYLESPVRCIGEMARVLRPGGLCLATAAPLLNLNGYWLVNRTVQALPVKNLVRLKQFFTTSGRLRRQFASSGFDPVEVHGVYFGPINWIERLARPALPAFLRSWERVDAVLADLSPLRELSNMFLVRGVRRG